MHVTRLLILTPLFALMVTPAYAYLDPGTGSIIIQSIIGAFAVGAASISLFWQRVKSFFFRTGDNRKQKSGREHK